MPDTHTRHCRWQRDRSTDRQTDGQTERERESKKANNVTDGKERRERCLGEGNSKRHDE